MDDILLIVESIYTSILQMWPYLLLTIPLSVLIHISGFSKHINKALRQRPAVAIILATIVGAFSPFCSCGVIPIIASLLISGVPLAPIMSFWIASPSMDPEIFFLSVGVLGWNLAVWRLVSTLVLSLSAGYITEFLVKKSWFGNNILVSPKTPVVKKFKDLISDYYFNTKLLLSNIFNGQPAKSKLILEYAAADISASNKKQDTNEACLCEVKKSEKTIASDVCGCDSQSEKEFNPAFSSGTEERKPKLFNKILRETWDATYLVVKFMSFAFLVKAILILYIPEEVVLTVLGKNNSFSIFISTLVGVPFYTSNIAALPLIGGFIEQGMDPGAALAFLIAGPITTMPAMAAVWGIANKRVFFIYILIPILGALFFGYLYNIINSI